IRASRRASSWKLRCSRFAPGPKTRKKEPQPSLRSALRSSKDASQQQASTSFLNSQSESKEGKPHGRRKYIQRTKSRRPRNLHRRARRSYHLARLRSRRHQSRTTRVGRSTSPHLSAPATAPVEGQLRLAPGQSQQARNVAGPAIAARETGSRAYHQVG